MQGQISCSVESSKKKSFITSLPLTTHIICFHGESTSEPVLKRFWYLSLVSSHSLHMPAQLSSGTSIVNVDLSLHLHPFFDFCLFDSLHPSQLFFNHVGTSLPKVEPALNRG